MQRRSYWIKSSDSQEVVSPLNKDENTKPSVLFSLISKVKKIVTGDVLRIMKMKINQEHMKILKKIKDLFQYCLREFVLKMAIMNCLYPLRVRIHVFQTARHMR